MIIIIIDLNFFSAGEFWAADTLRHRQYHDPCELEPARKTQWKRHILQDLCVSKAATTAEALHADRRQDSLAGVVLGGPWFNPSVILVNSQLVCLPLH